ncbi:GILT family protein [Candidatus Woesearchaeota archaeon]|jgi:glutaredoxin|nr:GILT family protein [Candidatus Woesearchaeota archaeon]
MAKKSDLKLSNYRKPLIILFIAILILSVITQGFRVFPKLTAPAIIFEKSTSSEIVTLDFYVMSQCPYGTQVEDAVYPVLQKLGNNVDFNINYIATDLGNGQFSALHGQPEVLGNIVQLCAMKYNPENYMSMIVCQNKNAKSIPGNWEQCAKDNDLDVKKIKTCYEGDEGKQLLSVSAKKTNQIGATGSPTIYLNGQSYGGGRTTSDFMRSICNEFSDAPAACSDLPKSKEVSLTVLTDGRCKECDVSGLISSLKGLFPGLKITTLDYNSREGTNLYASLNLKYLPSLLFDDSVKEGEGYSNIQGYLQQIGEYQTLKVGATFDPNAEICDNDIDDDNNNLIDCNDPGCSSKVVCRQEQSQKLDLFVMSQCPFGVKAENAMKEILENFPNIDFDLHFIANDNGDGTFSSLHGQPEVDGNIRQSCIEKYYPNKFMDYIWCQTDNYQNIGSTWESCASKNGISTEAIKTCAEGEEGKQLLRENIKLTNDLNIGSSPTWFANNRYQFSGIDAETVKQNFCSYNPGLPGCENVLSRTSTTTNTAPSAPGCVV